MPEAPSAEGFSPQKVAQARRRLTPLSFRGFIPEKPRDDVPTGLSPAEVQEQCFSVLGYLEEYYQAPKSTMPEVKLKEGEGAKSLEKQLDSILHPDPVSPSDSRADKEVDASRKALVRQRLEDLLAIPQVRERFESEFDQEIAHYQAARRPMKQVRDIDRVAEKLRLAIYKSYLGSKKEHGKLTQSTADQIGFFQEKMDELGQRRVGIEGTATRPVLGYLETQKLLEYKKQQKENGFAMTPSRKKLIDRISREAVAGNKIFLVGSTGTGKTKLGFYALDTLTGGYELINWHEGTTPRDIFGYRELWTDEAGNVQSGMKPGPTPKALERGVGVLHEEYTGGSTRTQLATKFMMGARPGEQIQIPGFNGQVFDVTNNFIEILTGNPKDERTKQREDMDPAILRELTGVEVDYMPSAEMRDIILSRLIEENGILKLGKSEVAYVEQLTKAAEMMQRIHNRDFSGFSPEMKSLLGIDAEGNTETTLNANFLDPGTLLKLFGEWDLARARGQSFADYTQGKLHEFVQDPKTLAHPEERKTLQKILSTYGLLDKIKKEEDKKGYTLPSGMAGESTQSNINPVNDDNDAGTKDNEPQDETRFSQEARRKLEEEGYAIYQLTGESLKTLRDKGRTFWSTWHKDNPAFEDKTSRLTEVAIRPDPNEFFLPDSSNKTLAQQEQMVAEFSRDLNLPGVEAIIGEAADYEELAFQRLDDTGEYLFGEKYGYKYTRTKTPTVGSEVAHVGYFDPGYGLGVHHWVAGVGLDFLRVAPLVVPVNR